MEKKTKVNENATFSKEIMEDFDFLGKLVVGIGEVSEITGVPQRQLRYWEEKGIIESHSDSSTSTRRFNYLEIKKILLIKELIDEGYTLDAAATKVSKRMETVNAVFNKLRKK